MSDKNEFLYDSDKAEFLFEENEDESACSVEVLVCEPILEIPGSYQGVPVTEVLSTSAEVAVHAGRVWKIVLPKSLKVIGYEAFAYYHNLTDIEIPEGVEAIYDAAFDGCASLRRLRLPEGVKRIGRKAFYNCDSLEEIELPESLEHIGDRAFDCCYSLKRIRIPKGVSHIGYEAFSHCESLEEITVSEGSLHYESYEGALYSFGKGRLKKFPEASPNRRLAIGESVYVIEDMAASGALRLEEVSFPSSLWKIEEAAFNRTGLLSLSLPEGIESLGDDAFSYSENIKRISLPKSLVSIGSDAFTGCKSLVEITVEEDNPAFKTVDGVLYSKDGKRLIKYPEAKPLESFVLPCGVEVIEAGALANVGAMRELELAESLRYIDTRAVEGCDLLEKVELPEGVVTVGENSFAYCKRLKRVKIPKSVTKIGERAFCGCFSLEEIAVDEENESFKSPYGVLYSKDGAYLCQYPIGRKDERYEAQDGVTHVCGGAFAKSESLRRIILPSTAENIAFDSFHNIPNLERVEHKDKK